MLESTPSCSPLELWAGIECTVNRVYDTYHDQLEANGHATRLEDLDLFAQLGIRALRYPLLWERTAPNGLEHIDWTWAESRLSRLRALGVRPIVGLVHHGSGPSHTSLIHDSFAEGLAQYAARVAERFEWIEDWTPVNEPLTTARFSGLYGHWYPHGRDEQTFARALVTQCRATALAMQAIRRVNPAARLVQTDDLGKTYSTPHMQYQADFENERRWLSWDLLSGLVDRYHRMWHHLLWAGINEAELRWFLDNPCPPDIVGINHYVTSERFLDENFDRYPADSRGENGQDRYADVEAVRVLATGVGGIRGALDDAWARYKRPLAITEVHLGCTREEQMRWLLEVWNHAGEARQSGIDVRAITAWALLGSFDWNTLLTRREGHYEPGIFDLRAPSPRPTALAAMLRQMAAGRKPDHPVLARPGWWRRAKRLLYAQPGVPPKMAGLASMNAQFQRSPVVEPPILIVGADKPQGYAFARLCDHRGLAHQAISAPEINIADPASVEAALARHRPWAVINAISMAGKDTGWQPAEEPFARKGSPCEEAAAQEHIVGSALLATICARHKLPLLTFSSDLVFNGRQQTPYLESDRPTPRNDLSRSLAKAETLVQEIWPRALIVRVGALFGPWDACNFVTTALREIAAGGEFAAPGDVVVSPTYLPDLAHACLDLLIDGESGLWHLANAGAVTWAELARQAAEQAGLDAGLVQETMGHGARGNASAPRLLYNVLGSERGQLLQPLEKALDCYFRDCGIGWRDLRVTEHDRRPGIHSSGIATRYRAEKKRPARSAR